MASHRIQIFNPHGGKRAKSRPKRSNPLSELIFMSNPKKKSHKKHHNPFGYSRKKNSSSSPKRPTSIFSHPRRRHHNPRHSGGDGGSKGLLELGGGALIGLFGSNFIAEFALGANNSGVIGYAATGGIGLALALLAKSFGYKRAATGVGVGALLAVAYRVYQDMAVTPTGKANVVAAAKNLPSGNADFSGMGTYTNVQFPYPLTYQYAGGPGNGLQMSPPMNAIPNGNVNGAGITPAQALAGSLERDARY